MNRSFFKRASALLALLLALSPALNACVAAPASGGATPPEESAATAETPAQSPEDAGNAPEGGLPGNAAEIALQAQALGFRLLPAMMEGRTAENAILSPAALFALFDALALGAAPETAEEIAAKTGLAPDPAEALKGYAALLESLEIKPYAAFVLGEPLSYKPEFLEGLAGAVGTESAAFGEEGGTQAANAEAAKLSEAFAGLYAQTTPAERLYLLAGAAPSMKFAAAFPFGESFDGFFDAPSGLLPTKMLYTEGLFGYYEDENFQLAAIPMQGGRTELRLLLPSDNIRPEIAELLSEKGAEWLLSTELDESPIRLTIPSLDLSESADLREDLLLLGLQKPFGQGAGLSFIEQEGFPLYVNRLDALARLKLSESGVNVDEPAQPDLSPAAFDIGESATSMNLTEPFLLALVDKETGLPLLLGWINLPSKAAPEAAEQPATGAAQ
ncbi:MAG: serpin family protein [Christensenellaceae bacterium]|jgi:hypothetical protein|nr:serpin family protein [Christensenellaceae bacterium]